MTGTYFEGIHRRRRPWVRWGVLGMLALIVVWRVIAAGQTSPGTEQAAAAVVASAQGSGQVAGQDSGSGVAAGAGASSGDGVAAALGSGGAASSPALGGPGAPVAGRASPSAATVRSLTPQQQAQARAHWSPATMAGAAPVEPLVAAPAPTPTTSTTAPVVTTPAATPTATPSPTPSATPSPSPAPGTTKASLAPTPTPTPTPTPAPTPTAVASTSVPTTSTPAVPVVAHPAVPVTSGTQWTQGGLVARTTGKVFFTLAGVDYACSGSAIASPNGSTVLTAAHCVEGDLGYATHWVFVPGYDQGSTPYGVFPAVSMSALPGFTAPARDMTQDVAFVKVGPNAAGQTLAQAVGGQQIGFDGTAVADVRALGFPAAKPYTGLLLEECAGPVAVDPRGSGDLGLACALTGGSSGGPWLTDLDPGTGAGRVVSVTSFGYTNLPGRLFGPPLGPAAQQLFATVSTL